MEADYADTVKRECGSSSTDESVSKHDSTRCQTGESKDSKRSLALSHAEVIFSFFTHAVQLECRIFMHVVCCNAMLICCIIFMS